MVRLIRLRRRRISMKERNRKKREMIEERNYKLWNDWSVLYMIVQYYTPVDKSATNSPRSIIRPEIGLFTKTTFAKKMYWTNVIGRVEFGMYFRPDCSQWISTKMPISGVVLRISFIGSPHQSAVPPTCEIPLRAASRALIGVQRLRPDFDASRFFKILHSPAHVVRFTEVIIPTFVNFGTHQTI